MTSLLETLDAAIAAQVNDIQCAVAAAGNAEVADQGERLVDVLDTWLLDDEQRQALTRNPEDVFLLFAGAILCDAGRIDHGLGDSSADVIRRHWRTLGLTDAEQADALAKICSDVEDRHLESSSAAGAGVHHRFMVAAIRLARGLDLAAPAIGDRVRGLIPAADRRSVGPLEHWYRVSGVGPHPYLSGTIRVQVHCRHDGVHRALKHYESIVQAELHQLNRIASPRFLFSDVVFEIVPDGYQPVDLKFTVDSTAALQLFMGNRLYADKRVYLRELIQNAVDACNLRRLVEGDYTPRIEISFNDDISVITIRDNGIGMSRQWIEKYFLKIGISFYQSDEIRNAGRRGPIDFNFISQFGIGFLSSFLVAERIVVRTRKADQPGLMITITDLKDYFDARPLGTDFPQGTEVALHLKPLRMNYCRSLEYVGYLKTNIRFLSVPVHLRNERGKTTVIGMEQMSYDTGDRWGIDFVATLGFTDSDGYLLLRAKKQTDYIQAVEGAMGGISIFQDGIFVTQVDTLLPEGARANVVGRINLLGEERCELSMDRNRIFWTDVQLRGLKRIIRHGLVAAVNRFVAAVDSQSAPENTRRSIVQHLAIFFDFNEIDDAMHARLCEPIRAIVDKRFRDFLRIHFAHALKTRRPLEADGYSESWQQQIIDAFARRSMQKN